MRGGCYIAFKFSFTLVFEVFKEFRTAAAVYIVLSKIAAGGSSGARKVEVTLKNL